MEAGVKLDGLCSRVSRAAEALKSYFGARRVVLFGSLAGASCT